MKTVGNLGEWLFSCVTSLAQCWKENSNHQNIFITTEQLILMYSLDREHVLNRQKPRNDSGHMVILFSIFGFVIFNENKTTIFTHRHHNSKRSHKTFGTCFVSIVNIPYMYLVSKFRFRRSIPINRLLTFNNRTETLLLQRLGNTTL